MIIAAAIKFRGLIFTGYRHDKIYTSFPMGFFGTSEDHVQGFLDNRGHFYNRNEAANEALFSKQIDEPTTGLMSEELWTNGSEPMFGVKKHPWQESEHPFTP